MDGSDPPQPPLNKGSDPPQPPPKKRVFKGKRSKRRSLSRNQDKRSNNQKRSRQQVPTAEGTDQPAPETVAATSSQRLLSEASIFQKTTKKEYADMLANCQRDLANALAENAKKDAAIEKLTKKIEELTAATKTARGVARESRLYAKSVQDEAHKTAKKMQVQLEKAEEKAVNSLVDLEQQKDDVRVKELVSLFHLFFF